MSALRRLHRHALLALAFLLAGGAGTAWAFTQSGAGVGFGLIIPMGHEWITRMAGVELMGFSPAKLPDVPDPKDPRKTWRDGLAKNTDLSAPGAQAELRRIRAEVYDDQRYASRYKAVYDVIVGERWVDLAGYNAATSQDCWDAVAQEPAEIQYDHFMRRYDDRGGKGGVDAARRSQERFKAYFKAAAIAPSDQISVYDGGVQGSTAVQVNRNYFLFGRAVHLFEDSFSAEHTVRNQANNFTTVRQVKSYLCAAGSEQHTHSKEEVLTYRSGDVVWYPGTQLDPSWASYKASNMKPTALVATEAMKDAWAAFIRVMGTPAGAARAASAEREAQTLVDNWLSFDERDVATYYDDVANRGPTYILAEGQTGPGMTVKACMVGLNVGTDNQFTQVAKLEATQRKCLYNAIPWVGYQDLFDTQLHVWFAWRWRNGPGGALLEPPKDWTIPNQPADTGLPVRIRSVANRQTITAADGLSNNAWVYAKPGAPLDLVKVGPNDDTMFRVASSPWLFLSYNNTTGAVKLFNPYTVPNLDPTNYVLTKTSPGWSIKSSYWNQYMWLSRESPYITRAGDPYQPSGQWTIEGLFPVLTRGVLLAGQFRTQAELNGMSAEDMRNTLIVELSARTNQTNYQSYDDDALARAGALLVFLRTARIRDDAGLKKMSVDDLRNTLIVELAAQTGMAGGALQALDDLELILLGLTTPKVNGPLPGRLIRGVLLAGQFRTQAELNRMSAEDMRNTLIVELSGRTAQKNYQSYKDADLASAGALLVLLRTARIRNDAGLKAMTVDNMRNTLIVELAKQKRASGPHVQALDDLELVLGTLDMVPLTP